MVEGEGIDWEVLENPPTHLIPGKAEAGGSLVGQTV